MINADNIKVGGRKVEIQGLPAYQPKLVLQTPFGDITHLAKGLYLTSASDALLTAQAWKRESLECGYITQ